MTKKSDASAQMLSFEVKKKVMKSRIFLFLSIAMIASCGLIEIGDAGLDKDSNDEIWGGPVEDEDVPSSLRQVCYMTALEYPKGYDWHSDVASGTVRCSLRVYMNSKLIMKVPVGDEYEMASAPDMHRIIDGHLYTDYSSAEATVIKKDGVELFRYQSRERMCGMCVLNEDLFTLGESRDGAGFSYRKNGQEIISRTNGSVLGDLRLDGDTLCFTFMDYILTSDGYLERYYAVQNGVISQIAVREDLKKVWDTAFINGNLIYVATLTGVINPVLINGTGMTLISLPQGAEIISARLICSAGEICADILCRYKDGTLRNHLWKHAQFYALFPAGCNISAVCLSGGGFFCALNPAASADKGYIYRSLEQYMMPEGYMCMSRNAIALVNGILNVGLSSQKNEAPMVWKDGQLETLDINGYISAFHTQNLD